MGPFGPVRDGFWDINHGGGVLPGLEGLSSSLACVNHHITSICCCANYHNLKRVPNLMRLCAAWFGRSQVQHSANHNNLKRVPNLMRLCAAWFGKSEVQHGANHTTSRGCRT